MTVQNLWTDRDTVIARFTGDTSGLDGLPHHNKYCWILRLRGTQVFQGFAYLDLVVLNELLDRVPDPSR